MKSCSNLLPETMVLITIGMVDMLATLVLVGAGWCRELNPIMAFFLEVHWLIFILVKVGTLVLAGVVCEWYRQRNEPFVRRCLKVGIVSYLVIWTVWFATGWEPPMLG